jgi:hypothetical protein
MSLPHLEVTGGFSTKNMVVKLNGVEIPGLMRLEFIANTTDVNRAVFEIGIGQVTIDAETVTDLIANYDKSTGMSKLP